MRDMGESSTIMRFVLNVGTTRDSGGMHVAMKELKNKSKIL